MPTERLFRSVMDSPLGPLTLVVSARGARAIQFGDVPGPAGTENSDAATAGLARQLQEYFAGERRDFDYPLDWQGTTFQQQVWRALTQIPFGRTASYRDVAESVGRPQAQRAVGGANRHNPLPILVPCHRVIGAHGDLVGYAGRSGLDKKAFLLALER